MLFSQLATTWLKLYWFLSLHQNIPELSGQGPQRGCGTWHQDIGSIPCVSCGLWLSHILLVLVWIRIWGARRSGQTLAFLLMFLDILCGSGSAYLALGERFRLLVRLWEGICTYVNARTQSFPIEHCIIIRYVLLVTCQRLECLVTLLLLFSLVFLWDLMTANIYINIYIMSHIHYIIH